MKKKGSKTNLDAEIKKAEGAKPSKGKRKEEVINLGDMLPKEAVSHLQNSQRELLLGCKIAFDGFIDQAIDSSDKMFK